jgi:RND superfamily putative drug exporter
VLVGGPTAEETDLRTAIDRDTKLLVPLVLLVVVLVLVVLLRALAAPLMLLATVVLSYFAALGFSVLFFEHVLGLAGEDPSYAFFAFIFLVALGVDYNIFLMARVREEALAVPTREATLRGLAVTGGVITSAGVVLAGTFAVLSVLPLVVLTQVGFTVAFGVLLDTLVVRSILVPALTLDLGERTWWPSALWRARMSRR